MQTSPSTPATIISAENQNDATIAMATFFFCHYYIVWESNNAGEARTTILKWKSKIKMHHRRIVRVIPVVQSENILLCFLRRGHADDGCSCNHRAVPPSEAEIERLFRAGVFLPRRYKISPDEIKFRHDEIKWHPDVLISFHQSHSGTSLIWSLQDEIKINLAWTCRQDETKFRYDEIKICLEVTKFVPPRFS